MTDNLDYLCAHISSSAIGKLFDNNSATVVEMPTTDAMQAVADLARDSIALLQAFRLAYQKQDYPSLNKLYEEADARSICGTHVQGSLVCDAALLDHENRGNMCWHDRIGERMVTLTKPY